MTALVSTSSLCPACRMVLLLHTPVVLDEDGDPAIERSDIERAVLIHLRLSCPAVGRMPSLSHEDEDEGVP